MKKQTGVVRWVSNTEGTVYPFAKSINDITFDFPSLIGKTTKITIEDVEDGPHGETTFENAKEGDKVWSLIHGWCTVVIVRPASYVLISIKDTDGYHHTYYSNGKYTDDGQQTLFWDKPVYDIPTRPKRKVKKELTMFVNIYKDSPPCAHSTLEEAENNADEGFITTIPVTGTYEVEE